MRTTVWTQPRSASPARKSVHHRAKREVAADSQRNAAEDLLARSLPAPLRLLAVVEALRHPSRRPLLHNTSPAVGLGPADPPRTLDVVNELLGYGLGLCATADMALVVGFAKQAFNYEQWEVVADALRLVLAADSTASAPASPQSVPAAPAEPTTTASPSVMVDATLLAALAQARAQNSKLRPFRFTGYGEADPAARSFPADVAAVIRALATALPGVLGVHIVNIIRLALYIVCSSCFSPVFLYLVEYFLFFWLLVGVEL